MRMAQDTAGRGRRAAVLAAVLAVAAAQALADADTRVTAVRTEGTPVETNDFYHDATGLEVFGLRRTTPVKVVVRRIDGSDWTREDIEDAARQLVTCQQGTASVPTARVRGALLTLRFECSLRV